MNEVYAQISGHPWDSLDGLIESGKNGKIFGSCSMPDGGNAGCAYAKVCKVRREKKNLREQTTPAGEKVMRETPVLIAVARVMKDGGAGNVAIMSCWNFHRNGCARERLHPEEAPAFVQIVGYEGDKVPVTSRIRKHIKPEPNNCEGCRNHACALHEEVTKMTEVPRFTCYSDAIGAGRGERLKKLMMEHSSGLEHERLQNVMTTFVAERTEAAEGAPASG